MVRPTLDPGQARLLLEKVQADSSLAPSQRRRARQLRTASTNPEIVLERLQRQAIEVLPTLDRRLPATSLCRAVTAAAFRTYHAKPEVKEAFLTSSDFVRYVESQGDKAGTLRDFLRDDSVLFPWQRSWLAEAHKLNGLDGAAVSQALELEKDPPFVIFHFEVQGMVDNGVLVRRPCSLDSVLGPNLQWRPTGLVSGIQEFVDGDVPVEALADLEWRA
ncbi:hypothetical protein [Aeromicrobium fastidiosum]|uniref:Uncharacterized protein n=1 Tax=Aeromicrobium fastidiosum TaxID=52699 RepID=A0A641AKS8_9ACTN|nr:hypothetical protein [Aeromicrobium fastidiosum]KAA1375973.1 hypothetical protein ESP62_010950 [Aeromicrobium fastidiosum]MBP2392167.1 hypothetical protein [Aeromicrobium fastidiosum]